MYAEPRLPIYIYARRVVSLSLFLCVFAKLVYVVVVVKVSLSLAFRPR